MKNENKTPVKLEYCPECKNKLQLIRMRTYGYYHYWLTCFNSKCKFCGILRYVPENKEDE